MRLKITATSSKREYFRLIILRSSSVGIGGAVLFCPWRKRFQGNRITHNLMIKIEAKVPKQMKAGTQGEFRDQF